MIQSQQSPTYFRYIGIPFASVPLDVVQLFYEETQEVPVFKSYGHPSHNGDPYGPLCFGRHCEIPGIPSLTEHSIKIKIIATAGFILDLG